MGINHLSAKTLRRASKRTPQAASAYRRGIRLVGPDGTIHDYRRRARGIRATAIFAPAGCDWVQDPQTLWDRADAAERRQDSRTAREYEIALPAELPWPERQRLAEAFAQHLVEQFGVAVDLAIHEPAADGKHDERNHHAHFLTTTRRVTPDGMGEKTRALDLKTTSPALIEALRAEWARLANETLARHGAAPIDHRSHERRELEAEPTLHEGPKVTWLRRERDVVTARAAENDAIKRRNAALTRANRPTVVTGPVPEIVPTPIQRLAEMIEQAEAADRKFCEFEASYMDALEQHRIVAQRVDQFDLNVRRAEEQAERAPTFQALCAAQSDVKETRAVAEQAKSELSDVRGVADRLRELLEAATQTANNFWRRVRSLIVEIRDGNSVEITPGPMEIETPHHRINLVSGEVVRITDAVSAELWDEDDQEDILTQGM